jgi:hypothetical protein
MLRKTAICLSALVLLTAIVAAASPDFSGKWVMNKAKSEFRFGPDGPVPDVTMSVQQGTDSIKVSQTFAGEQGEFNQEFDLKINGAAQEIQGFANQPAKASAKWDASVLVVLVLDISQDFQGGDTSGTFTVNERWELSADGKTLTIVTKLTGPMGDMNSKRVMEKQ